EGELATEQGGVADALDEVGVSHGHVWAKAEVVIGRCFPATRPVGLTVAGDPILRLRRRNKRGVETSRHIIARRSVLQHSPWRQLAVCPAAHTADAMDFTWRNAKP